MNSNIKLRPDGTVKVLDFGLAKNRRTAVEVLEDGTTVTIGSLAREMKNR